jgi:hypothetical protein
MQLGEKSASDTDAHPQTGPESRRCTVLPLTSTDVAGEVVMSSMSCVLLSSPAALSYPLPPRLPHLLATALRRSALFGISAYMRMFQ